MPLDPSRRAALNLAKLTALAKSAGASGLTPLGFPGGAAASDDAGGLWVFGEHGPATFGGALSIALRGEPPARLVVIVDDAGEADVIARRAAEFASPATIEAASVDGTSLVFQSPFGAKGGHSRSLAPNGEDEAVPDGVEVVHEHGVTTFEVRGLEIGRLIDGEVVVGVGKHDREAHVMAFSGATLDDMAARICEGRRHDAPGSAMTSYGRERWLRSIVVGKPEIVGLGTLTPVAPPLPRKDLRDVAIAPAVGDGVVVAFSVGVDLDLVPSAADVRAQHAADAELVLVVPEADALPTTHRLAAALRQPARVITVPNDWAALGD